MAYTVPRENLKIKNDDKAEKPARSIILIGNANVGKSVIFGLLTGKYVIVSNYPGTTVEITKGTVNLGGSNITIIDTPGVANLLPMSADEVVTRDILLEETNKSILLVADAKNPSRSLLIALQIAEMEIPFSIAFNMADEARERRVCTDTGKLSKILGVSVVPTIAVSRTGLDRLKKSISNPQKSGYKFKYDDTIEDAAGRIADLLPDLNISKKSAALMLLAEDTTIYEKIKESLSDESLSRINEIVRSTRSKYADHLGFEINRQRLKIANSIVEQVTKTEDTPMTGFAFTFGRLAMDNIWGIPILLAVLAVMYYFVGRFAAGTVVDYLRNKIFGVYFIPWITKITDTIFPIPVIHDLLVGDYGIISVGLTYAIAIVLPIVAAFFFFFGLLEDSGYLPRLAIMANRIFSKIGLNGKAILPMILGLGCGTMATVSSRILDTKKERLMVVILLALCIPCSAQLGIILGMLGGIKSFGLLIWIAIIGGSIMLVGYVSNKLLPGETSDFILEIPPLRIPSIGNIAAKTLARIEWYLKEAFPMFILAMFVLFVFDKTGMLSLIQRAAEPVFIYILGLPVETVPSFIIGFLRRDYGAAGLYDMAQKGLLNNNQVLISMVVMTLFIPCVAQFFVIIKENGLKAGIGVLLFTILYALTAGGLLNFALQLMGVNL